MAWDICIHGDGITGNTLALLLAQQRLRVGLVGSAKPAASTDVRAYALNTASRQTLQSLGAWPEAADHPANNTPHISPVTPVQRMQVWGDDGGHISFDARSLGQDALSWIVDVPVLEHTLHQAVAAQPLIERTTTPGPAKLHVVCEGKASALRSQLGVELEAWPYPHHALATRLHSELGHGGVARQWFSGGDILALLPMDGAQGHTVGVVWSTSPAQAAQFAAGEPQALAEHLSAMSHHTLGQLAPVAPAAVWPLQRAQARQWTGRSALGTWVLAGDAAHTLHPLAGQGLNLGLADVARLSALLKARDFWRGPDDARLLRRYERERKAATLALVGGTDGLQWLFSQHNSPWTQLRNWGLNQVDHTLPLKQWLAKQAMNL